MKKRRILFFAVVISLVITACGSKKNREEPMVQAEYEAPKNDAELMVYGNADDGEVPAIYEFEADIIRYREPILGEYTFRKDVEKTETDHAVYYFEAVISEQERQACIAAAERAFTCMDDVLPQIEVVALTPESYEGVSVLDHRLYTSRWSEDFHEFLTECLLTAYGEWGNYGLAYGYADHLCRKAGISDREMHLDDHGEAGFVPMSSPELYDLNLLCFDERFASQEDVEAAKNNACLFADWYLSEHSETEFLELLSDSGTAEGIRRSNEALEAFYEENGVECSLTEIRYQYGGAVFDYAAACEYAAFYLSKDWQEWFWKIEPSTLENFLHENYREVKAFFECNAYQMGQYQEFFAFDSYNNELPVIFKNEISIPSATGVYYSESHRIYLRAVFTMTHEYIHSVMFGHYDSGTWWKCEGSARYFAVKYDEYHLKYNDDMADWYYSEKADDIYVKRFLSILNTLGKSVDTIDAKEDTQMIENLWTYVLGYTDPNASYESASSFVGYLVDRYGEKEAIQYICSDDLYNEEWGKSYEELVQEWNKYIEESFSRCETT